VHLDAEVGWQSRTVSVTRPLAADDGPVLAALLRANRAYLSPWQPARGDDHFTDGAQQQAVEKALGDRERGASVPLVVVAGGAEPVGTVTLQSVIRGSFQSCSVGYWLAEHAQGGGLATAALREATQLAFHDLGLHRVQAETLVHNVRSQRVLDRVGFVPYGTAEAYLKIAGRWQDHVLYQLLTPRPDLVLSP